MKKAIYALFICCISYCSLFSDDVQHTFKDYQISFDSSWKQLSQNDFENSEMLHFANSNLFVQPKDCELSRWVHKNEATPEEFACCYLCHITKSIPVGLSTFFNGMLSQLYGSNDGLGENFRLLEKHSGQIQGHSAKWLIATAGPEDHPYSYMIYITRSGEHLYFLSFFTTPSNLSRYRPEFEKIANSLTMN